MKYIEQRIETLEKEVAYLKSKQTESADYLFNQNPDLLPDLETSFDSPWDLEQGGKNFLDVITYPPYPNILGSWEEK